MEKIYRVKLNSKGMPNFSTAVEVADRPQGEWYEVDSWEAERHSVTDMRCSICGKYASIVLPHKTRCVYDFCPFCGAKIKGADDE